MGLVEFRQLVIIRRALGHWCIITDLLFSQTAMIPKLCLMTCLLALGQGSSRTAWSLVPRLGPGQELVYSGSYVEESLAPGVHFQRAYQITARLLVLENAKEGWKAAFHTSLVPRPNTKAPGQAKNNEPVSVRMEMVNINTQGQIRSLRGIDVHESAHGPPTLETGLVLLVPRTPVRLGTGWEVSPPEQPKERWTVIGREVVGSTPCVKIQGIQKSPDWDEPRADRSAWKRTENVWLAPQNGIVYRVERTIEQRAPARKSPSHRFVIRYEKDSHLTYPARFFQDCQMEVLQADKFNREAEDYLQQPARFSGRIDVLLRKVEYYLKHRPSTPYRPAILHLQKRLVSARKGETVGLIPSVKMAHLVKRPASGVKVPNLLLTNLATRNVMHFKHLTDKPLLVIYYNPDTDNGEHVMRFAKDVQEKYKNKVGIVAMAVTKTPESALKQQKEMGLPFPIMDGRGYHRTFGVDATPRCIIVNENGWIRNGFTGWGLHSPAEVLEELESSLKEAGN